MMVRLLAHQPPTQSHERGRNPTVRLKKRRGSINPGSVDTHALVLLVAWTVKGFGTVGLCSDVVGDDVYGEE